MTKTILVPLDGSPLSERAMPYATTLAKAADGRLVLVRAAHARALPGTDPGPAQLAATERAESELTGVAEQLRAHGIDVDLHVYYDDPAAAILDAARRQRADLVVMSTHGRGGLGRAIYGSVADRVMRGMDRPVLLVPAGAARCWPHDPPLRILVPLDGSELAAAALGPIGQFAEAFAARLTLLRIVQPPDQSLYGEGYAYIPFDEEAELAEARAYLDRVALDLRTVGRLRDDGRLVDVCTAVGQPALEIARVARETGANVLAMATHGYGGLARLVMGSVATSVLQRADVPLLLTRPAAVPQALGQPGSAEPTATSDPTMVP